MKHKRWSQEETKYLLDNYKAKGAGAVADYLQRSIFSVQTKWIAAQKQPRTRDDTWSKSDIDILTQYYVSKGSDYVSSLIGRSRSAVRHKASRLNIGAEGVYRHRIREIALARNAANGVKSLKGWKNQVKRKYDFVCQKCGLRDPRIIAAHHITPCADGGEKFNVDNGITLCPNCHAIEHYNMKQISAKRIPDTTKNTIGILHSAGYSVQDIADQLHLNKNTVFNYLNKT